MSGYNPYGTGATGYGDDGTLQQQMEASVNGNSMMMGGEHGMSSANAGGQSLDEIVNQNLSLMRGQSMSQHYANPNNQNSLNPDLATMSMMEFTGNSPSGPLDHFAFDPSTGVSAQDVGNHSGPINLSDQDMHHHPSRRQSSSELALNPSFSNAANGYPPVLNHANSYRSTASTGNPHLDMGMASPYMAATSMGMNMDYANSPALAGVLADQNSMAMYYHSSMMNSPMTNSPINPSATTPMAGLPQDSVASAIDRQRPRFENTQSRSPSDTTPRAPQSRSQSFHVPSTTPQQQSSPYSQHQQPQQRQQQQQQQQSQQSQQQQQQRHSISSAPQMSKSQSNFAPPTNPQPPTKPDEGDGRRPQVSRPAPESQSTMDNFTEGFGWKTPTGGWPSSMAGRPHIDSVYKNAYSSTGFDILGVLMRIATRPNPEINLGSVDFSCAFVVCDAEKDDSPIVYCSDNFERLTGYTRHMILGRNCRFLQSPDGAVEPGVKRKYVDDDSVLYLKNMVNTRKEAQISLINYRRGGQPFMNLLTVIPITWDSDQVKFFVGFQVDLVEQPNAVTNRNPDGTYSINYQRGLTMPRYVMNAPEANYNRAELGQTIPRDDVSAILSTIGSGESEYAKRMWDKVLLENTDDVVHVLSLKGLFQWISPSSLRVLEYEPGELIGTALSSVCHPSDIVPVTRELKDTSSGASVNVVFRIRRKNSGYMWFEGHGSLHTEQGKGRKSIILVGRERPVYTLSKADIQSNSGIGENELWTKMSTSGMFLFVSSNVRQLLDRQPDELIGVSIQSLMRADSKNDFVRILELARTGKKVSVKHEMINRRGQVLQAFTTLYPGDATEGQKPTFIVAQTRLIKYPRGNGSSRPAPSIKGGRPDSATSSKGPQGSTTGANSPPARSPQASLNQFPQTQGAAATYAGQNGLVLGRQDVSLASDDNLFDELKTTKSSSWQYEIRQLEKKNRMLAEEVQALLAAKKKRKRRKGAGQLQKDCANCHTRVTPEWRRGPSGQRDLCNSCGLRWAKLNGRISPRTTSMQSGAGSDGKSQSSASPGGDHLQSAKMDHTMRKSSLSNRVGNNGGSPLRDGHAANMEGANKVPEKIEETTEPD